MCDSDKNINLVFDLIKDYFISLVISEMVVN